MCCGNKGHHSSRGNWPHGRHHAGSCACGGASRFGACFLTREEKVAWLEQVLEDLQEEAKAIEERIAKLKAEA